MSNKWIRPPNDDFNTRETLDYSADKLQTSNQF